MLSKAVQEYKGFLYGVLLSRIIVTMYYVVLSSPDTVKGSSDGDRQKLGLSWPAWRGFSPVRSSEPYLRY